MVGDFRAIFPAYGENRAELNHNFKHLADFIIEIKQIAYDDEMNGAVLDDSEGDRIARILGDKTTMIMGSHGITTVGTTVADAFCELAAVERSAMWQMTAKSANGKLKKLPDQLRKRHLGLLHEVWDSELEFAAYRRMLDREEPDYAT